MEFDVRNRAHGFNTLFLLRTMVSYSQLHEGVVEVLSVDDDPINQVMAKVSSDGNFISIWKFCPRICVNIMTL